MSYANIIKDFNENGYSILNNIYVNNEVEHILTCIENTEQNNNSFLKTRDLFAIRQLIINIPELKHLIFNSSLRELISNFSKSSYFLSKAIYFDKPSNSNWFVGYHQDLSISVDKKLQLKGYKNWTYKKGQYGVQPPVKILEDTVTVRVHLDDTNENNGALKVIPKSHLNGIIRAESEHWNIKNEYTCNVKRGGVMLMKPLTLHTSNRTTNGKKRRVIHLEFNHHKLVQPLKWLEYLSIN
ncbi:phytanoyl-CoA dioxygenase family protein [Hyunsoonleella ulvae]|uniref:phytanoyl-CoA dioxygenase family protein n=1 Tax=Hyunsoonleella ulvae TaxID=2799948 RepID=UPI00193A495B|nr:phytanoyl-CoA dioxygenase family protein [Hyunsoonleella ulvae]